MRAMGVLAGVLCLAAMAADDVPEALYDGAHGLRCARRIDERTIRLTFGASFVPGIGGKGDAYRVVSADDAAFQNGVRASSAAIVSNEDAPAPAAWHGSAFKRHTFTVTLPQAMQQGRRYFVQVLGGGGRLVTGGRAARWIEEMSDAGEKAAAERNGVGVRRVEIISPLTIQITTGPGLDVSALDTHPERVVLRCADDVEFMEGRKAIACGRRSRGECIHPDGWPWSFYLQHELFAVFDKPLKQGRTYTAELNAAAPLICGASSGSLRVDDRKSINPALKVNQVGYLPDAPAKYAYLGAWMGSLGACDFGALTKFEVRNAANDDVVFTGDLKLRHKAGEKTEGVYKEDFSFENVYELDFSAFKAAGSYYVCGLGAGRSLEFKIASDIYAGPFKIMMSGILHQRCGIEMKMPYSEHYRPACHRNCTELTDYPRASEAENFKNLPLHVTDKQKHDLFGGHHDAGDYNPRSHLEIAENAFLLYEIKPAAFTDGQLRVPEAGNGVPDLLDEARWALDLWVRLQDEDGGVRNGTESDGDPDMATPAELDTKRDFAFAKDAAASLRFAACAAQASIIWGTLKKDDEAKAFLARAVRAWDWALQHEGSKAADGMALAAIQLYRATGETKYLDAFHAQSVFNRMANAQLEEWQKYDQRDASFYYAFCSRATDAALKAKIVAAFKGMADAWCAAGETCAYRFVKNPYAPISWGAGAHPKFLLPLIQAQTVAPNPAYRKGILCTCDYALGCNPMNLVFTTGLGQRHIGRPLHMYSRYSPGGPIAGLQCEGPSKQVGGAKAAGGMGTWIAGTLFPHGAWPTLQTYADVELIPEMNEGVVVDQMKAAMGYGFLVMEK